MDIKLERVLKLIDGEHSKLKPSMYTVAYVLNVNGETCTQNVMDTYKIILSSNPNGVINNARIYTLGDRHNPSATAITMVPTVRGFKETYGYKSLPEITKQYGDFDISKPSDMLDYMTSLFREGIVDCLPSFENDTPPHDLVMSVLNIVNI